jgi:hypothetical protein
VGYPASVSKNQNSDWDPKAWEEPERDVTLEGLQQSTFDFYDQITVHQKPTFLFGIDFGKLWNVSACKVGIVVDGWMRMYGMAEVSNGENRPFTYRYDAGAGLTAHAEAPDAFGWNPQSLLIASISPKTLKRGISALLRSVA